MANWKKKKDIVIIAGDWNAKVGRDNNRWERVMGNFGYGDKNDRGERLLEFALEHDMMICHSTGWGAEALILAATCDPSNWPLSFAWY